MQRRTVAAIVVTLIALVPLWLASRMPDDGTRDGTLQIGWETILMGLGIFLIGAAWVLWAVLKDEER